MHKQLLIIIVSAALCLFICLATPVNADRTVRTGIYNFKPLVYSTADGAPTGLYVDILNHIAQKENWNIVYQHGTWQEGLERLKNNQIDLLVCIGYTPEREKFLDFPEEYLLLDWGLVYTAKKAKVLTIMDLEGKTVTALKGSIYTAGFKELLRQFNIRVKLVEVDQAEEIFASVKNGTADAGVTASITGILNKTAQSIERSSIIFTPVRLGYAVNGGKNQDLLAALDQHIAGLKADKSSVYYSALEKMLGKAPQKMPAYLYISIALVIGLLTIALLFIAALRHQVRVKTRTIEENEKRLRDITDNAPCVIFMKDLEGRYLHANRLYEELFHLNREAVIGKTDFDIFPPEHATAFRNNDLQVLQNTAPLAIEEQVPQQDGMHSYLSVKFPLQDSSGKTYAICGIATDITERARIKAELQAKNNELESFTYTASHDLKSPLITIQSYAGMIMLDLQSGNYSRATQDLERISSAAIKMAHLLDNLLQLSRVGRHIKSYEQLNLNRLLDGVLAQLAGPLADKNIQVAVQPELPTVNGDRIRLEELLQNLLENAIKYLGDQPAPRIEVGTYTTAEAEQVIFVRDNGIGIASQHHETVFGLFNKLDAQVSGTGIGLALTRKIVEAHGGKIWVESNGPGTGSCFCFTLPPQNEQPHTSSNGG